MTSSFFFQQVEKNTKNEEFIDRLSEYAENTKTQIYVIQSPLLDAKYEYGYQDGLILLAPKHQICFIDLGGSSEDFQAYIDDVIEDIGAISDKFRYKEVIGRSRQWRNEIITSLELSDVPDDLSGFFANLFIASEKVQKKCELIISLLTGSINDIDKVGSDVPGSMLEKVRRKIQLFDGQQTRFIYQSDGGKVVRVQGLSGTGKTELLLHKLRDIYVNEPDARVIFTCHNRILSNNLKRRIPEFFNFMKVEEQIKWNERLWCVHAWGSHGDQDSGAYRHITAHYGIPFYRYNKNSMSFEKACRLALEDLDDIKADPYDYAFDYMLVDESQDFGDNFVDLCSRVTRNTVFVAGDIFQNIFDESLEDSVDVDFLLTKCYRTDPRTLMFAHGLGLGLFEDVKLRWLGDNEWTACGYIYNYLDSGKMELSREPLRRFEDIQDNNYESLKIMELESPLLKSIDTQVKSILEEIRRDHPTVLAEDIGIIFVDESQDVYSMADMLEGMIEGEFEWDVNKAYESKNKKSDAVFVSNKNNVKGLEFPFVICVSKGLSRAKGFRNALYMMLTRSFIRTYFLVSDKVSEEVIGSLRSHIEYINNNGVMVVDVPSDDEIEGGQTRIDYDDTAMSLYEIVGDILSDLRVEIDFKDEVYQAVREVVGDDADYHKVEETVRFVLKMKGILNED